MLLAQVGPLGLLHAGQQLHFGQVQQLRNRHARRDLVPFADLGQRLPEAAAPARAVLEDRHQPRERREHARLRDPALVAIHVQLCLVQLLAQHRQFGLALLEPVLDVRLELLLAPPGFLEGEFVLARVNIRQQLVALDLQFRSPHLEIRLDDLDFVLALADLQFGFGLLEVLLNLLHRQQAVFQRCHALGVVQFEDQVATGGEGAHRRQLRDLGLGSDIGRRQGQGAHGPQLAAQVGLHDQVAPLHFGEGEALFVLGQALPHKVAAGRECPGHEDDRNPQQ